MTHIPVLVQEVLSGLCCSQGGCFLDCTVGCGGHTRAILEQHPQNYVIGLDRDMMALEIANQQLQQFAERVVLYHQRFEHFEQVFEQQVVRQYLDKATGRACLDGILFDLGVSSLQLDDPERGFSFQTPGRLDMRMDRQQSRSAYEVVNTSSAEQLADIFFRYGEERQSRRIARKIVEAREQAPLETTTQLAELVSQAVPKRFHPKRIHPATRVFQALRIEVNDELRSLGDTLERAVAYLRKGGRICVISFHSLEDRLVKRTFARLAKGCQCPPDFPVCVCGKTPVLTVLTRKPIGATAAEQTHNPRSRSAKLRIAQKIV